ncbi:SCO family protein [Thiolapillus sp.]
MSRLLALILAVLVALPALAMEKTAQDGRLPKVADAPPGGDFTLHMGDERFSLKDLRGKVVLLYFGYTKCPDVCPTSLSYMTQALNGLREDELKKVVGVFVSVDPGRDTPELLREYVAYFHPNFIGVTGTEEEIARAARLYGAQYYQVELEGSAFGYAVNHSAATYLVGPDGVLRFIFPHNTPSEVITEAIRYILEGN